MNCHDCGKELTGGIDTFGEIGDELCMSCYFGRWDDEVAQKIEQLESKLEDLENDRERLELEMSDVENAISQVIEDIDTLHLRGRDDVNFRAILSIVKVDQS